MKPTTVEYHAGFHQPDSSLRASTADLLEALMDARHERDETRAALARALARVDKLENQVNRWQGRCCTLYRLIPQQRRHRRYSDARQLTLL